MDHIHDFLKTLRLRNYSIYTVRNYERYLLKFRKFYGQKNINNASCQTVIKYHEWLKDRGLRDNTIALHLVALRNYYKDREAKSIKALNPRSIQIPKHRNKSHKPIPNDQVKKLFKAIDYGGVKALRDELIVSFLFSSGVRVSELCDTKLDDIDLKEKRATIITKKTRKERVIFWDDLTNDVLVRYLEMRPDKCDYVFVNLSRNAFGKRITTRSVQRIIKRLRIKAGILERYTPHSFRHAFITHGAKKGVQLPVLQKLAGHSNWLSTQVYTHLADPLIERVYKKIYTRRLG